MVIELQRSTSPGVLPDCSDISAPRDEDFNVVLIRNHYSHSSKPAKGGNFGWKHALRIDSWPPHCQAAFIIITSFITPSSLFDNSVWITALFFCQSIHLLRVPLARITTGTRDTTMKESLCISGCSVIYASCNPDIFDVQLSMYDSELCQGPLLS